MPDRGPEVLPPSDRGATRLPAALLHGYGVGALGIAFANTAVLFFLLKYLVDGAGLSPAVAGTVLLAGKAWDAVTDPVVGRLSDRTRHPMGARRPWIAFGALPFALLFGAIWWGLPLQGTAAAVGYALLLVAYNTAYTAVVVPYGALTPVLSRDYDERTRLNAARMGWSMAGGIVAGVLMPALHASTGSWRAPGVLLAVAILAPLAITVVATRGRDVSGAVGAVAPAMWSVLRVRSFRRTAGLFLAAWSSIAVLSALVPFYAEHHLGRPQDVPVLFLILQVSALLAVPLISVVARRTEKHRAYAVAVAAWAFVLLLLVAVPPGAGRWAYAVAALVGPGIAAAHVLPWSMLPDVVEADRAAHGQDRAGAFYGVMTFLEKGATAVALYGLGWGLQLAGYVEGAAVQPESARYAILALMGPLPGAVLLVAAVAAWWRPPLTRAEHRALVARLQP